MAAFTNPSDVKVGVVGYGGAFNMGRAHLQQMQSAGMTPVAVAELDEARLEVAKEEFPGIATFTSVTDMLAGSDVNFVTIITPHNTHAPLALECLEAGRHVCLEKPMAITTAECESLMAAAQKKDLVLTTYHNRHWDGCILKAMKKIKEERIIGDIVRIEARMGGYGCPGAWWRGSKSISGGILYDWGVHLTEYALQLMDDDMTEVSAYAHNGYWHEQSAWKADTNEDEAMAVVRFKKGGVFMLRITTLESDPDAFTMKVTGTSGCYHFSPHGNYRIVAQYKGEKFIAEGKNPDSEGWRFYQNVADFLVGKEALVITPQWSTRPIHMLDLADQSAKQGKALPVKFA